MQLYVAWVGFQRRAEAMQGYFGYEIHYMPGSARNAALKMLFSYPHRVLRMAWLVARRQPDVLWIQAPPNFVVHIAWLARLFSPGPLRIVADLHNSALSPRWLRVPLTRLLLNRFDVVLVHNKQIYARARQAGVAENRLRILEDRTPVLNVRAADPAPGRPSIVMPCSFYSDEPVEAVIAAARALPQVDFLITGPADKALRRGHMTDLPPNVRFTGFLDTPEFDRAIADSYGVLCLTTEDGVQLSSAREALSAAKPMIVSDTSLLRSLFGQAAVFCDNTADSIRTACIRAILEYRAHAEATRTLRDDPRERERWLEQAEEVRGLIEA